jgi:hypothetical protein
MQKTKDALELQKTMDALAMQKTKDALALQKTKDALALQNKLRLIQLEMDQLKAKQQQLERAKLVPPVEALSVCVGNVHTAATPQVLQVSVVIPPWITTTVERSISVTHMEHDTVECDVSVTDGTFNSRMLPVTQV